jgi:hypothetical protein
LEWLNSYRKALKRSNIDPQDCCIVGSSCLEVFGICNSTNIDFTVSKDLRNRYFNNGVSKVGDFVNAIAKGYHHSDLAEINDDMLIYNPKYHFYFRGLKFASLEIARNQDRYRR